MSASSQQRPNKPSAWRRVVGPAIGVLVVIEVALALWSPVQRARGAPADHQPRPELAVIGGHGSAISSLVFSSDGKKVLSGSYDGNAILWDAATGLSLRTFQWPEHPHAQPFPTEHAIAAVAFGPDGRNVIAVTRNGHVIEWETATGRGTGRSLSTGDYCQPLALSPDGRSMVGMSGDEGAAVRDTATGKKRFALRDRNKRMAAATYSRNGQEILTGSYDGTVLRWNAATGKRLQTYREIAEGVCSLAFSPDGRRVLAGFAYGSAVLWDAKTAEKLHVLRGHVSEVSAVAFSPDGHNAITGSHDKRIVLWDLSSGKRLRTFWGHAPSKMLVGLHPNGRQAAIATENASAAVRRRKRNSLPHNKKAVRCSHRTAHFWGKSGRPEHGKTEHNIRGLHPVHRQRPGGGVVYPPIEPISRVLDLASCVC